MEAVDLPERIFFIGEEAVAERVIRRRQRPIREKEKKNNRKSDRQKISFEFTQEERSQLELTELQ